MASRNERTHLRHQHNQRRLPKICRFAAHVWASDEQELLATGIEAQIVGNEALAALAQEFFDDWMTPSHNKQLAGGVKLRPRVTTISGQLRERSEHIKLCDSGCRAAKARSLRSDDRANLDEECAFDLQNAFIRSENLALVLFQLGRSKPFGVHERLLSFVVGRREMEIGL